MWAGLTKAAGLSKTKCRHTSLQVRVCCWLTRKLKLTISPTLLLHQICTYFTKAASEAAEKAQLEMVMIDG